jgi:hypothetical protein
MVDDLLHIAVHEAGHAVIGRVLGMECGPVTIVPDDDNGPVAVPTIETLVKWMKSTDSKAAVMAARELLDRGWGKPDRSHHHDGDIRQHIISDRPLTVDEWTTKYCRA